MRNLIMIGALVIAGVTSTALAASPLTPLASSKVWVDGTSTVRDFSCKAKSFTSQNPGKVEGASVEIAVANLDCGNGTMNEHMSKALDASKPIKFVVTSYTATGADKATVKGNLTIHGQTRPVTLTGTIKQGTSDLRVSGQYQLAMTDYGVKPPTLMLGTMKVNPSVTVHYDLAFAQEALQQLAPNLAAK